MAGQAPVLSPFTSMTTTIWRRSSKRKSSERICLRESHQVRIHISVPRNQQKCTTDSNSRSGCWVHNFSCFLFPFPSTSPIFFPCFTTSLFGAAAQKGKVSHYIEHGGRGLFLDFSFSVECRNFDHFCGSGRCRHRWERLAHLLPRGARGNKILPHGHRQRDQHRNSQNLQGRTTGLVFIKRSFAHESCFIGLIPLLAFPFLQQQVDYDEPLRQRLFSLTVSASDGKHTDKVC